MGAHRHFSGFSLKLPLLGARTSPSEDLRLLSRPSAASVPVGLAGLETSFIFKRRALTLNPISSNAL